MLIVFFIFFLANVLNIMGKDLHKRRVISPIWCGNLQKPMVFGHKLVIYQEEGTNVL